MSPRMIAGRYNRRVLQLTRLSSIRLRLRLSRPPILRRGALSLVVATLSAFALAACDAAPVLPPNPFRMAPTRVADLPPTPTVVVIPPTATPVPFAPYWVKNHRQTEMWSGQVGDPDVVSFGVTSDQFCVFRVVLPQNGPRLFVQNPFGRGQFWIDADAVGPVSEEPQRIASSEPGEQNCAAVIYEGASST